ncbi:uncharacterized protein [Pseudochaenichthys georgianus]|uniref:uncharacterized protein n=1 Tax=Pseudochaenichthys georgianus TaxID=52239 RepID=UPI00146BC2F0|nr:uncharacterized protein LOC117443971 [Pseudochaenichthys georgianus]XP_033935652.1 uncharacterized protein LOC117443971 [Pseudochaenichthys georgianus]
MAAYAILRRKTSILETLVADYSLILNKAEQNKLITRREYNNLKSINKLDAEGHVVELVDKIMNKGEETCQAFLKLLQTDEDIQETYPELKNIFLPHPVQASSVDNTKKKRRRKKEPEEGTRPAADQLEGSRPVKKPKTRDSQDGKAPWEKSIFDLKSSGILETEAIVGKVVKKSELLTSTIKTFYFYLCVADETASIKLMVYGKDLHRRIQEGSSYTFRNLTRDGLYVKVNASSSVSETKAVKVPEELEREAERLLCPESPLTSIKDIKSSRPRTHVSVEGTVTQIYPVKKVKVKEKETNQQSFKLKQEAEEISVTMWDKATKQSKDLSVGDVLLLNNMTYSERVSLNSSKFTKLTKVQSILIRKVALKIRGIKKATLKETHLEVDVDTKLLTLVVASRLLAKALDFQLKKDFQKDLLERIPLSVEAEIQGHRIINMSDPENI